MTDQDFLSPAEAAARLGVSYKTLTRMADADQVPCVRIGAGWRRFPADAIDAIVARRQADSVAVRYELRCAHEREQPKSGGSQWFDEGKIDLAWAEHDRRNGGGRSDCKPWTLHEITTTTTDRQLDPGARPDA